ncbi:hypothetical protein IV203_029187 [Nitzschia inconspicua]|uniref:Uncharacterized protein n=1 Tax=Nitzschia inconspicua TaxID=303405 RepID=A0A9K3LQP5_9STRA|nr:hypothetical protein IV203_029187 [Nitzschia inconspicua]
MIIDAKSIIITLLVVTVGGVYGLKFIRKFALQIAQENHDAVVAMEQEEEQQRLKKERAADAATAAAFAKVEPILKVSSDNTKKAGAGVPALASNEV